MKPLVIYHRSDYDGIFCREIAKYWLGIDIEVLGLEYGDDIPVVDENRTLYILDFSVESLMNHPKLIWIDHHKSAIEKFGPKNGYQIDGVAACRLTWQWFLKYSSEEPDRFDLPNKEDFINRHVSEPLSVRLAGEYDIWDKRDPNAELFQHGLNSQELDWSWMFAMYNDYVNELLEAGKAVQFAKNKENASIINAQGFELNWEGLRFLCINSARFNSLLFDARVDKDKHDALLGFNWNGKHWRISLYHTPFNKEIDLSQIAVKYGGGGHKGACGFTCKELPFNL